MDAGLGRVLREGASRRPEHHSQGPERALCSLWKPAQDSYSYGLSTATSGYETKQYPPPAAGHQLPATATLCPPGGSGRGQCPCLYRRDPGKVPFQTPDS